MDTESISFKDKLLANEMDNNISLDSPSPHQSPMDIHYDLENKTYPQTPPQDQKVSVPITIEDKQRIYYPWRHSVINKLQRKRIPHDILKKKLTDLWKPSEPFPLIDLGEDYYIVYFNKEENMTNAIQTGPWFIYGRFLSVQRWVPNFVASQATQSFTAIWIRLPQLPIEFYDRVILQKKGSTIGRLLKIDACTSAALRGRYARLCVELLLNKPVTPFIFIGSHKQYIHYKGDNLLCTNCGHLGHSIKQCTQATSTQTQDEHKKEIPKHRTGKERQEEIWKTVSFNKGKRWSSMNTTSKSPRKHQDSGINVNIFEAKSSKFLSSQKFVHKRKNINS
ncbi:uncharacterized protein [Nicotiana sylvestris]|uniref:uncharacterized protein n=1 Tax=Nicotiana sylvestris TaxID=4096 RepID=UPI00388C654F